ncbi:hypothetical protein CBR_g30796 [Chara braunii]|uniref:B12-dependent ribonucleotide reductase insertion domain-containing protein n=1 Tax=Chara braunii TaxID=69332 RepID=A0A388JXG2_CHABU|nr:hypothetical protein CBR_g30796 [Chara braunii]|eukprot:GBG62475.1 hypothetical protein CBR_g30796 [Chara braunii]
MTRYSRWMEEKQRRETWEETVDRYCKFINEHVQKRCDYNLGEYLSKIRKFVLEQRVMPSMRCLMTAGPALERENLCGYNCSYLHIDSIESFDEILYILMNGVGVGFSVETHYVAKLPRIPDVITESGKAILVEDSKEGWAKALREVVSGLFEGKQHGWDLSAIRPQGSRLKTFGGRASGPGPLDEILTVVSEIMTTARGRQLRPIECCDMVCVIARNVAAGGSRRSALMCLSSLDDKEMRDAKNFRVHDLTGKSYRFSTNISVNYHSKPDTENWEDEWRALVEGNSGERGIFSSYVCGKKTVNNSKLDGLPERGEHENYGTNPCCEIVLKSNQCCNLSELIVRPDDTKESLVENAEVATVLGTIQSTLTNFNYVRSKWAENCEQERLLGVSMTGILDCKWLAQTTEENAKFLHTLRKKCVKVNELWAERLGIARSKAITCIKPSGTVSELVGTASGIHPRHSEYYIRRIRNPMEDPVTKYLVDQGFGGEEGVYEKGTWIFSFPVKSPDGSTVRSQLTALTHIKLYKFFQDNWCHHKPSITVTVKPHEWDDVKGFVFDNFDHLCGISFLPYDGGNYQQMPYEEVDKQTYEKMLRCAPSSRVNWVGLRKYERVNATRDLYELACVAGGGCAE